MLMRDDPATDQNKVAPCRPKGPVPAVTCFQQEKTTKVLLFKIMVVKDITD